MSEILKGILALVSAVVLVAAIYGGYLLATDYLESQPRPNVCFKFDNYACACEEQGGTWVVDDYAGPWLFGGHCERDGEFVPKSEL